MQSLEQIELKSVGEDVTWLGLSYIVSGSVNWYNHFGKLFGSYVLKLKICLAMIEKFQPSVYLQEKGVCESMQILYRTVHKSSKLEMTQMPINSETDTDLVVLPYDGMPLIEKKRKRLLMHTLWVNLPDSILGKKSQSTDCMFPPVRVGRTNLGSEKSESW